MKKILLVIFLTLPSISFAEEKIYDYKFCSETSINISYCIRREIRNGYQPYGDPFVVNTTRGLLFNQALVKTRQGQPQRETDPICVKLMEILFFTWEEGPAVLKPVRNGDRGYFISPGNTDWTLATPGQVADFFVDGSKMSKTDFEGKFGKIGKDLPMLPEVT